MNLTDDDLHEFFSEVYHYTPEQKATALRKFIQTLLSDRDAEIERLRRQLTEFRDCVLHGRHQLEAVLDNDQTNAVLSLFDDTFADTTPPSPSAGTEGKQP